MLQSDLFLDAIAGAYSAPIFINGGSIGIAMICVLIVSFRRGTLAGILTGLVMGMLDLADGFYAIASTWYIAMAQVLFDYIIVYAVVGFAGLFRKLSIKENETKIKIGWLLFWLYIRWYSKIFFPLFIWCFVLERSIWICLGIHQWIPLLICL